MRGHTLELFVGVVVLVVAKHELEACGMFEREAHVRDRLQPESSRLLDLGMWWLTHHRAWAMWWYNQAIMPLGVFFQSKLVFTRGMLGAAAVDEVFGRSRGNPLRRAPTRCRLAQEPDGAA